MTHARTAKFLEAIQADSSCPVLSQKIFRCAAPPKLNLDQFLNFRILLDGEVETGIEANHPASSEGRFAIVTDVRRAAVDADGAQDECA